MQSNLPIGRAAGGPNCELQLENSRLRQRALDLMLKIIRREVTQTSRQGHVIRSGLDKSQISCSRFTR
jgi:hypothetical protein